MTRRAAVLLVVVLAAPVAAQNTYKPGRTADGHPDLTGIWEMRGTANWNLEGHTGGPGVPASRSVIVDPPDGKIPYHPASLRSEEHTSELQSQSNLVCRLLLEKKKNRTMIS